MEIEQVKTAAEIVRKIEELEKFQEDIGRGKETFFNFRVNGQDVTVRTRDGIGLVRPRLYDAYVLLAICEVKYELRELRQELEKL